MADQELLKGVVGVAGTALVVPLSLPALKRGFSQLRLRGGYALVEDLYQDEDGTATEDSIRAYTDLRPRIALWLSISAGLAVSIASKVLSAQNTYPWDDRHYRGLFIISSWVDLASWVGLLAPGSEGISSIRTVLTSFTRSSSACKACAFLSGIITCSNSV